jgi:hypothetical protein
MNFFGSLTDAALRRVYKFVLKRSIGKYLQDEFVLDQVEVKTREGTIKLYDLNFNVNELNEEFLYAFPIKLESLTINELEVHLSYLNILQESCQFFVDTVELSFVKGNVLATPTDISSDGNAHKVFSNTNSTSREHEDRDDISFSSDGQSGLNFIAHWVEVILSRLRIQVNKAIVRIVSDAEGTEFCLELRSLNFLNGDPSTDSMQSSSLQYSSALIGNSSLKSSFLSRTRRVRLSSFLSSHLVICFSRILLAMRWSARFVSGRFPEKRKFFGHQERSMSTS